MARTFANTTGDYLQLASSAITAAPLSISAWVRLTAISNVTRMIVDLNASASAANLNCFQLQMNSGEQIVARTGAGAASSLSTTAGSLTAGVWSQAGAVFASSTSRTAYLDGVAATPQTTSRVPSGIDQVTVGVESYSAGSFQVPWNGEICEVGVWDVALSDAEMATLARGFSPLLVRPANLVYYWPGTGRHSPEIDPISAGGMAVNGTAYADHPRMIAPRRRQARRFTTAAGDGGFKAAWARPRSGMIGAM